MPRKPHNGEPCEGLPSFPDGIEPSGALAALIEEENDNEKARRLMMRAVAADVVRQHTGYGDLWDMRERPGSARNAQEMDARRIFVALLHAATNRGGPAMLSRLIYSWPFTVRQILKRHDEMMDLEPGYREKADRCARAMMARREEWS